MATYLEQAYSFVHLDNTADQPTVQQLQQQLEKGNDESKQDTMKRILMIMLNGDPLPQLLMHIIRFVMPSKSKPLKKLLYFYYEICPKLDANGKLKQEMILVWWVTGSTHEVVWERDCRADRSGVAMASEMICNIPMNTSAAPRFASCAS